MLLPVHTFFLHSSFLVPLCNVHNFFFYFQLSPYQVGRS
jgi:hypothetical protein